MQKIPKNYNRKIWRAIIEFDLLQPGDRVLVGLSGGKDSSFLLYALNSIKRQSPFSFEVGALTVDLGFPGFEAKKLADFCASLKVPFYVLETQIADIINQPSSQGPCAKCAFFRRGSMNRFAREKGYNKIALAHHFDDAVETFLMSQLYSGQLKTFMPKSYLDKSEITVIRPLIYLRENEVRQAGQFTGFEPVPSPCPYDGHTKRQEVKELIASLNTEEHNIFANLAAAMREDSHAELWPPKISKEKIRKKNDLIWKSSREALIEGGN